MIVRVKALNVPDKPEFYFGSKELAQDMLKVLNKLSVRKVNWEFKEIKIYYTKEEILNEVEKD